METDERTELVFGAGASSTYRYPTLCQKEIRVYSKIRALSSGTLSKTPDTENFASAYRSSKRVIDLDRESWMLRALDHRLSTKLTSSPSSDARPV